MNTTCLVLAVLSECGTMFRDKSVSLETTSVQPEAAGTLLLTDCDETLARSRLGNLITV